MLPAPSLTRAERRAVAHAVRRLGPALGVVGLLNVQLALADGKLHVLEANPRASRTVPFASKAIGVNLVQAACRLAAGETLADLDLGREILAALPAPLAHSSRAPAFLVTLRTTVARALSYREAKR